ncbi:kinase-like domain-containing protein [Obelidium mucronatum]|nr:kinase-like domain-containing protein [Obelidium mucronatum]
MQAARKHLHPLVQNEVLATGDSLIQAEIKLLRAVSGKKHMPFFLGEMQAGDSFFMYYQPWGVCSLSECLLDPPKWLKTERDLLGAAFPIGAQWFLCLLSALNSLHTSNPPIMHRDLTPSNIILTSDLSLVFIDFGVGLLCSKNTVATSYVGVPYFMAPELYFAKNLLCYNRTADIFSLGCIMSEILTVMVLGSIDGLDAVRKGRAFWQCLPTILKWLEKLGSSDAGPGCKEFADAVISMVSEKPFDRPPLHELHKKVLAHVVSAVCCIEELGVDGRNSLDSTDLSDDPEVIFDAMLQRMHVKDS